MNSTKPSCTESYPSLSLVRRCTTTHGPACSTVHGTAVPSSAKTCVIPSLIPSMPFTAIAFALSLVSDSLLGRVLAAKRLNFHVHARRQIELHQRVHRVRRRFQNVNQPLVRPHLELLARLLVHVRRAQHGPAIDHR